MNNQNLKPINQPVVLSTTFAQKKPSQWGYSRVDDPTRLMLECELAALEKANYALAFSSGSSAITSVFLLLKAGDHLLCHRNLYEGTKRLLENLFSKFNISFDFCDLNKINDVKKKIKPSTKLIFFENITNPNLKSLNTKKIASFAKKNKILVVVDNTICTPVFENPLLNGANIVVHSLTKFISGGHDVLGGAVMLNDKKVFEKLKSIQQTVGFVLSPFDCHLISRGIKTLDLRMKKQTDNAKVIFNFLKKHTKVKWVNFPGVSALVSFILDKKVESTLFLSRLKRIKIAQSFGGTESTILHTKSMMNLSESLDDNFFRLSVGLENIELLLEDLRHSLK